MITQEKFNAITEEVITSIENALSQLFSNYSEDYVLFMACGEYNEIIARNEALDVSPYTISGHNLDKYYDFTRQKFLCDFLNKYYDFTDETEIQNDEYRINIEFLIYTHIWEANPCLKKLYRLANLLCGKEYNWNVVIPIYGKSKYIKDNIISPFNTANNPLGQIIANNYNTDLRNAIAHSDYQLDKTITYKSKISICNMSLDDWSVHFVYSCCLFYHFIRIINERRKRIVFDWGKNEFTIKMPFSNGTVRHARIQYDKDRDDFEFVKQ
jgi:hypothetical protein